MTSNDTVESDIELFAGLKPYIEHVYSYRDQNPSIASTAASKILFYFLDRTLGVMRAIVMLRTSNPLGWTNEAACLLRCSYDVSLQALYLVHDSAKTESLAKQYFDYARFEHGKLLESVRKDRSEFARDIMGSPLRDLSEPEIAREFERVKGQFEKQRYKNWYGNNLYKVSKTLGLEQEYTYLVDLLHGTIHASPFHMQSGSIVGESFATILAYDLVLRMADAISRHHGIHWKREQQQSLADARDAFI